MHPFAELSSSLALARRVLAGGRPHRTKEMDGLKLTDMQWESIVAAWDQAPSRRPVLSPRAEPMIYSWRPEKGTVYGAIHLDVPVQEATDALRLLSSVASLSVRSDRHRLSDTFHQGVIKVFSFIVHRGLVPVRCHEAAQLRSIHGLAPLKHKPADYDSPYLKIFLLLQAHFSRLPLSPELAADLAIVLERVFTVFSVWAHRKWSDDDMHMNIGLFPMFTLMHMCVQGMWDDDIELKQIPHFESDVSLLY
jgi:hypothetical protein